MLKFENFLANFNTVSNPLLAYLLKRKYINYVEDWLTIFIFWIIDIFVIVGLFPFGLGALISCAGCPCGLLYILMFFVPIAISYSCASTTSRVRSNQSYELLALTNISDAMLIWSYVVGTLYRLRLILVIAVGFAPITFLMSTILWDLWESELGERSCISTPIGTIYCNSADNQPVQTQAQGIAIGAVWSIAMMELTIGVAGIYLLTAIIGTLLGFMKNERVLILVSAGVMGFIVSVLTGIVILPELSVSSLYGLQTSLLPLLSLLLFALAPYLLTFGIVRMASPLVRRPA